MQFEGTWYQFNDAPDGSYACVHAPDGKLEGAKLSWMPLSRGQIPPHARRGLVLPIPEITTPSNEGATAQRPACLGEAASQSREGANS